MFSIQSQKIQLEYVIIDGGSKDDTIPKLKDWSSLINILISEKDDGIYDAMNKGTRVSSGEWLFFLNSGDVLYSPNVLQDLLFDVPASVEVVYGDVYLQQSNRLKRQFKDPKHYLFKNMICHQSFAVRRKTLIKFGGFDNNYRIFADKDFLLKALHSGVKFLYKPMCVAFYDENGVSSKENWKQLLEHTRVLSKYYSFILIIFIIWPLWILSRFKMVIK